MYVCSFVPFTILQLTQWDQKKVESILNSMLLMFSKKRQYTQVRTLSISGLKSWVLNLSLLSLKMMVKSGLEFILELTEPLQSCYCPVQNNLPRKAELAWQHTV